MLGQVVCLVCHPIPRHLYQLLVAGNGFVWEEVGWKVLALLSCRPKVKFAATRELLNCELGWFLGNIAPFPACVHGT